jgi:hypothetical protein
MKDGYTISKTGFCERCPHARVFHAATRSIPASQGSLDDVHVKRILGGNHPTFLFLESAVANTCRKVTPLFPFKNEGTLTVSNGDVADVQSTAFGRYVHTLKSSEDAILSAVRVDANHGTRVQMPYRTY